MFCVLINLCNSTFQDFFVASGEGLPRSVVEQEAKFAEEILSLFSVQVWLLILNHCIAINKWWNTQLDD